MNKVSINISDSVEVEYSTAMVSLYLIESEVKDFVTSGCPKSHIFVNAVTVACQFLLSTNNKDSVLYKIYKLTEELLNKFNDNKADELIDLSQYYCRDYEKLMLDILK